MVNYELARSIIRLDSCLNYQAKSEKFEDQNEHMLVPHNIVFKLGFFVHQAG